jgi:hypothetical protein
MLPPQLGGDGVDVAVADLVVQIPTALNGLEPSAVGDGVALKQDSGHDVRFLS